MDGVWEVDIRYFKKPGSKRSTGVGFVIPDRDVEQNSNSAVMAFDMVFRRLRTKLLSEERKRKGANNDSILQ